MRTWTFGQSPEQFNDWSANTIGIRSPYGPWGDNILQEFDVMELNNSNRQTIGWYHTNGQHKYVLMKILMRQVKAKLGQIPIIIQCNLVVGEKSPGGDPNDIVTARLYRLLTDWSIDNVTNRYKNKTGLITWTYDAWFPWWGADVEENFVSTAVWQASYSNIVMIRRIDAKPIIERALRDNSDAMMYLEGKGGYDQDVYFNWRQNTPYNPYLEFTYIFPIEFYAPLESGDIDLLSPMDDSLGNEYFLGAVERGETGQAVKAWLRNYSGATQQIDVWDDYPEVTQPYRTAGPGTGQLDYAEAGDPAVSQKYTAVFYSPTQYEVKAEAYREYPASLHPQINGDGLWRGDINTNFYSPTGYLKIPAAGWQPGMATGDEITFNVRGNSTDTDWPADSNDQVQMTFDIAGNPDNANWRPITAQRTKSTLTVTIDAATKFFPCRYVDPARWPVGNKAFVMNESNIDEGVIQSAQQPSIGAAAFTGTGLDDLTESGNFNGNGRTTIRVRIDGAGTPDTFEWSYDGGSTWQATGVPITGSAQLLQDGVYVTFGATTGHTAGDYWDIDVEPFGVEITGLAISSNIYGSGALVATSLPFRDVEHATFTTVDQASGASQVPASRLYVEDASGFNDGDEILVQRSGVALEGETWETVTIAAGGVNVAAGYLTLTTALTLDYTTGDFVGVTAYGHRAFWMRPVATAITVEELKRFRLNAKIF